MGHSIFLRGEGWAITKKEKKTKALKLKKNLCKTKVPKNIRAKAKKIRTFVELRSPPSNI